MNKDTKKTIIFILLAFLAVLFIIKLSPIILQNDTFYDIKLGERYFNQGMFKIDGYSIHPGLVYQTHHYLACILLYLVYSAFSFPGLYILEVILFSIIGFLFYKIDKNLIKDKVVIYVFLLLQLIAFSTFVSLRAWMFSSIIFLIEILCIEKYINTDKKKYAITLALLPLALVNFHSGLIYFYFIIMFTYMTNILNINILKITNEEKIKSKFKQFIYIIIIGIIVSIINPYFIDGLTYGFKTLDNYYINKYIIEFQPLDIFSKGSLTTIVYILIYGVSMIFSKRKIKLHELFLFLGTTYMTLKSVRHFILFVTVSVVLLPHIESLYNRINDFAWNKSSTVKVGNKINIAIIFIYLFFTVMLLGINNKDLQIPEGTYPIKATEYIKGNLPPTARIFNKYSWGSYLMFYDIKVFVDSRCDLYTSNYNPGVDVFKDYMTLINNPEKYSYIIEKYNIEYFLLTEDSKIANTLIKDGIGEKVYQDKTSIIVKVKKELST